MNKAEFTGRLTKQVAIKMLENDQKVAHFTLAVHRNRKDKDGNYQTDFINCVAWNKTAEILAKYGTKGRLIGLETHVQTGSYQDKSGNTIYTTDFIVDNLELLDYQQKSSAKSEEMHVDPNASEVTSTPVTDDSLPF